MGQLQVPFLGLAGASVGDLRILVFPLEPRFLERMNSFSGRMRTRMGRSVGKQAAMM